MRKKVFRNGAAAAGWNPAWGCSRLTDLTQPRPLRKAPERAGASEVKWSHMPKQQQPNGTPRQEAAGRPAADENDSLRAIATTVLEVFLAGT